MLERSGRYKNSWIRSNRSNITIKCYHLLMMFFKLQDDSDDEGTDVESSAEESVEFGDEAEAVTISHRMALMS